MHVRTGDADAGEDITAWLLRQDADVHDFTDAFTACVHLVRYPELLADLAFIGADHLAPHELSLVDYVLDTWPACQLILYRHNGNQAAFAHTRQVRVARNRTELQHWLSAPLEDLLRPALLPTQRHYPPGSEAPRDTAHPPVASYPAATTAARNPNPADATGRPGPRRP